MILPGVGAFGGNAMRNLRQSGLDKVIREVVDRGTLFLGICLGLQVLFESSEEAPGVQGLGICKGKIVRRIRKRRDQNSAYGMEFAASTNTTAGCFGE